MTKDPVYSARSKHIEARYFFIRELVQGEVMTVQHVKTEDNVADVFTKPLPQDLHAKFVAGLGLC